MWRSHTSRSSSISSTKCGACWQADSRPAVAVSIAHRLPVNQESAISNLSRASSVTPLKATHGRLRGQIEVHGNGRLDNHRVPPLFNSDDQSTVPLLFGALEMGNV